MARGNTGRRQAAPAAGTDIDRDLAALDGMNVDDLRTRWRLNMGTAAPTGFSKDLIARALAYHLQELQFGSLCAQHRRLLETAAQPGREPTGYLKVGSVIVREHKGALHEVVVVPDGFCWNGQSYASLSIIARRITGTHWNGPRFFGLRGRSKTDVEDRKPDPVGSGGSRAATSPAGRNGATTNPTARDARLAGSTGPARLTGAGR